MPKPPFSAVERDVLSEKIAAQLLALIKDRHLSPGAKLPAERELAAVLQVSRPSLREALRALSIIGAVEIRQGDGTYVTSLEPDLLADHIDYVVALNDSTFEDLFEARKALEVCIAEIAARRVTSENIVELESCLDRSQTIGDDYAAFLQLDLEFHDLIVKAARNPIFQSPYIASIRRLGRVSRIHKAPVPGLPEQSYIQHGRVLDALRSRDAEAARQAMSDHLNYVESRLRTLPDQEIPLTPNRNGLGSNSSIQY
jgi:GntR family transcriptional repressor for pyruvate dehydrogenase complex